MGNDREQATDGCEVRFGLRLVSTAGRHILVNGRPVKLRGFNRHDMYPQVGPAMPSNLYDNDLELLTTTLNGNFIRGSHYPQDPRFLDRCDERGVLVWEEALAWGNRANMFNLSSPFMAAQLGTARVLSHQYLTCVIPPCNVYDTNPPCAGQIIHALTGGP